MRKKAFVLLEDGTIFHGSSIGLDGTVTGEICFNTGMSGYQEIFTDPSYKGQLMVTANVHIGNYGIADEDSENDQVQISGLIMRNFSEFQSRPRSNGKTLKELLKANDIVAISDVDTRALVKHIRKEHGDFFCLSVAGYPEGHPTVIKDVEEGRELTESEQKRVVYSMKEDGITEQLQVS